MTATIAMLLDKITIRQLALGCLLAAMILFALREGWNYWKK